MLDSLLHRSADIIDYFISASFRQDIDMRYKARLLVGCILSFLVGIVCFAPFFVTIEALSREAAYYYYVFALPIIIFWGWLLYLIRRGDKYTFASQAVVTSSAIVLFGGVLITGGPDNTEVLPLVTIPVILSFMMLGQRAGMAWTAIIAGINYLLVVMHYKGFDFMNVAPAEATTELRVFNWSYSFFTIAVLVMIYEALNRRLTHERNLERERFRHMAMHDALTGLPNRKYFDETLASTLAVADRNNSTIAVGLMDLNGFKPINDKLGHEAGDIVLQIISRRMQEVLRKSDKVARLGGDEFGLIMANIHTETDITTVCDKILNAIAKPINLGNGPDLSVSGSLGIAIFPDDTENENQLRVYSDHAMYYAKRNNCGWHLHQNTNDDPPASP